MRPEVEAGAPGPVPPAGPPPIALPNPATRAPEREAAPEAESTVPGLKRGTTRRLDSAAASGHDPAVAPPSRRTGRPEDDTPEGMEVALRLEPAPAPLPGLWLPWQRSVAAPVRSRQARTAARQPLCTARACPYNRRGTCTLERVEPAPAPVMDAGLCPHALVLTRGPS